MWNDNKALNKICCPEMFPSFGLKAKTFDSRTLIADMGKRCYRMLLDITYMLYIVNEDHVLDKIDMFIVLFFKYTDTT